MSVAAALPAGRSHIPRVVQPRLAGTLLPSTRYQHLTTRRPSSLQQQQQCYATTDILRLSTHQQQQQQQHGVLTKTRSSSIPLAVCPGVERTFRLPGRRSHDQDGKAAGTPPYGTFYRTRRTSLRVPKATPNARVKVGHNLVLYQSVALT